MIHPLSDVQGASIGDGTRIWQYVVVLAGARIGRECNVCSHCFIENDVVIGDRVTLKNGVFVWDGVTIEDDVFVGPNAVFTNDKAPRSRRPPPEFMRTTVRKGASIGANATILPGLVLGENCLVGAGSVVTRSVPPNAIVTGNPARITGYVNAAPTSEVQAAPSPAAGAVIAPTAVAGVSVYRLPQVVDLRGSLTVGHFRPSEIPFLPKRYFLVHGVATKEIRGEHALHKSHQFLVCVTGSCALLADDGSSRVEIAMNDPTIGVYLPPLVWRVHYKYSPNAVLMVFSSEEYDPGEYIRDYAEFIAELRAPKAPRVPAPAR